MMNTIKIILILAVMAAIFYFQYQEMKIKRNNKLSKLNSMKAKDKKIIEDSEKKGIPIFVLTAKDKCSYRTLMAYRNECMSNGCEVGHILGVNDRIAEFRYWQIENENMVKLPD